MAVFAGLVLLLFGFLLCVDGSCSLIKTWKFAYQSLIKDCRFLCLDLVLLNSIFVQAFILALGVDVVDDVKLTANAGMSLL